MQTELIEQIVHLPIAERVEILVRISRSLREELNERRKEISFEERKRAVDKLRGIAAVEGKIPSTDEEVKEDYTNYLSEKYK